MSYSSTSLPYGEKQPSGLLQKHGQKLLALLVWGVMIGAYLFYLRSNDMTLTESAKQTANLLASPLGPLFFILFYTLRPLLFFPASVLTIMGGVIFGPLGVLWVVLGSNLSALVAYTVGRFFGGNILANADADGIVQRYARRMRENSFETVLIMRFVYAPYDLVNYLAGLLGLSWKAFLLATILGSIPGTIFFTLFGASFSNLDNALSGELPDLNPVVLAISITMFVASLVISRLVKRREASSIAEPA